jgi:hypothetical protein
MKNKMLIISFFIILTSCYNWQQKSHCSTIDLLIDEIDLPQGSIIDPISSPVSEYPKDSAGVTASYNQDLIYHVIGNYSNVRSAKLKYSRELQLTFIADKSQGPWNKPTEITYTSSIADQYHLACGPVRTQLQLQCRMIARYKEYYVFFFAYLSDDGLNFEHLEDILRNIDQKMEACFLIDH